MEKTYHNYRSLALEIIRGSWLIEDDGSLRSVARAFLERQPVQLSVDSDSHPLPYAVTVDGRRESKNGSDVQGSAPKVMVVPMIGTLTKYDNCMGCSTVEVSDIIDSKLSDKSVVGFVLDIDSPGGSCASVMPAIAAIRRARQAGKPVVAHIDECASAAYWIASQTDGIFADNPLSEAGSIGAYVQFWDRREDKQTGSRLVEVYAPQSTDKNASYRQALEGKTELMEKELAKTVDQFISDVKAGRPNLDTDAKGVLSGGMFQASEAIANGLVNGMGSLKDCVEIVFMKTL